MELPKNCLEYLLESWNQFAKLLGVRLSYAKQCGILIKKMELHDETTRGSKEESKDGVFLSPSRCLPNLGDEIHPKGVEL